MIIPIRTDYRLSRTPWVNYGLLAVNVLLFLLQFNGTSAANLVRVGNWLLQPSRPEIHQFFTSVFLHGSLLHLIGNMVFLWVFGNAINDRFGHIGYLAFYLAGGVLAGVGYIIMSGDAPVLGASGAIAAVTGAYLVLFPRTRVTCLVLLLYVLVPFEIPALFFLLFQILFEIYMSAQVLGGAQVTVAHWAHSSGYFYGIAVAAILLATRLLPRDPFDLLSLLHATHRRHRYRRMVSGGYDPFGAGLPGQNHGGHGPRHVESRTVGSAPAAGAAGREFELRRDIAEAFSRNDLTAAADLYLRLLQVADDAVLSRRQQLDVANQLMASELYPQAADAYERFLKHYPDYEHRGDIHLLLGMLHGRYLEQYDRAEADLQQALEHLHDARKIEMARNDLDAVRRRRRA